MPNENLKSSLIPGKLVEMLTIDRDLTAIPPEIIRDARVRLTMVGGEVVYER